MTVLTKDQLMGEYRSHRGTHNNCGLIDSSFGGVGQICVALVAVDRSV